jgi:hypothetical protein
MGIVFSSFIPIVILGLDPRISYNKLREVLGSSPRMTKKAPSCA